MNAALPDIGRAAFNAAFAQGQTRAVLQNMGDVEPTQVSWLWPGQIAIGKVGLLVGDPGLSKSIVSMELAAHVTRGTNWPDGSPCPQGQVLLISAEDDPGDTISPRLEAAGADRSQVSLLQSVRQVDPNTGEEENRLLRLRHDITLLREAALSMPACQLIIIDPISAYLDGTDSHNNAEVRSLLALIADFARRCRIAVLAVMHLNKSGGGNAVYRVTGSLAFVAAARVVHLVARDKEDPDRRLIVPIKNNLARDTAGLAYRIVDKGKGPSVEWEPGSHGITADSLLSDHGGDNTELSRLSDAKEWLRALLLSGPVPTKEIQAGAKEVGLHWRTVERAKAEMRVVVSRTSGQGSKWVWALSQGDLDG